jgi:hypothetical protein
MIIIDLFSVACLTVFTIRSPLVPETGPAILPTKPHGASRYLYYTPVAVKSTDIYRIAIGAIIFSNFSYSTPFGK